MSNNAKRQRPSRAWKDSARYRIEAQRLGDRVRKLRKQQGLTLAEAAEKMELDIRHLQKVEAGTLNVTLVTLVRILSGLRKPFSALFRP